MATVGSVLIKLGLDSAEFSQGIKGAQASMERMVNQSRRRLRAMRKSVNSTGQAFVSMGARIALVAGPAALGALTVSSLKAIDAQAKFAAKIGISTESLSGLQLAASEVSGLVDKTTNMALQRMTRRMAEAANGTGEAKDAIKQLGLDAQALGQMTPDQQFMQVADAMQQVSSQGERVRLAFKLFDSEGVGLVNTLALGSAGLQEFQREAEALGIAINSVDASKVEAANSAMGRVKAVLTGIGNIVAVETAPLLTGIATGFVDSAKASEGFRAGVRGAVDNVVELAGTFANVGRVWDLFTQAVTVGMLGISTAWANLMLMLSTNLRSFVNLGLATWETFAKGIAAVINDLATPLNLLRSAMDLEPLEIDVQAIDLGRVDLGVSELTAKSEALAMALKAAMQDYNNLAAAPPPSEEMIAGVERMRQAAQAGAESATANTVEGGSGSGGLDPAELERRQANLDSIKEFLMSEEEALIASSSRRHDMLVQALESDQITKARFLEIEAKLNEDHAQRLVDIQDKAEKAKVKTASAGTKALTNVLANEASKRIGINQQMLSAIFDADKRAAIGEAIVNTSQAITKTMASLPFPANLAAAALIAAKGAAEIAVITGATIGGGGSRSSGGGGGGSVAATPATSNVLDFQDAKDISQPTPKFNVEIKGDLVSAEGVRSLVTEIETALADGAGSGTIVIRGVGG